MQRIQLYRLASLALVVALLLAACAPPVAAPPGGAAAPADQPAAPEVIEIEYWQYNFGARIDAMNQLI